MLQRPLSALIARGISSLHTAANSAADIRQEPEYASGLCGPAGWVLTVPKVGYVRSIGSARSVACRPRSAGSGDAAAHARRSLHARSRSLRVLHLLDPDHREGPFAVSRGEIDEQTCGLPARVVKDSLSGVKLDTCNGTCNRQLKRHFG